MKGMIVRGVAVALFSALMTIGAPAMATPTTPCTAALEGSYATTSTGQGFRVWQCSAGNWVFTSEWVCTIRGCVPVL